LSGKINDSKFREKTIQVLKQSELPDDVDHVAQKLGVGWATARAILLDLALEGRVQVVRTRRGTLFTVPKEESIPA
jgi:predicted ArsR family transcriptional regulator